MLKYIVITLFLCFSYLKPVGFFERARDAFASCVAGATATGIDHISDNQFTVTKLVGVAIFIKSAKDAGLSIIQGNHSKGHSSESENNKEVTVEEAVGETSKKLLNLGVPYVACSYIANKYLPKNSEKVDKNV